MNLRCKKCKKIFNVNSFDEVRIIQALDCEFEGSHVLSEVM
jgi:hypothetical protein